MLLKSNTRSFACSLNNTIAVFIVFSLLIGLSCVNSRGYENEIKGLDSITGALNQKLTEFKKADTLLLERAITKFQNYSQFIKQNINDTVSKAEADYLQQFFGSGKNLMAISENRRTIQARGSLINSQLTKLISDAQEGRLDRETLINHSSREKENAEKLMQSILTQQLAMQANVQEFKLSLPRIEELIRSRNNGQMPTVVKEEPEL
jgi:hypothetical protein